VVGAGLTVADAGAVVDTGAAVVVGAGLAVMDAGAAVVVEDEDVCAAGVVVVGVVDVLQPTINEAHKISRHIGIINLLMLKPPP
jgi:hypothetical protein